MLADVAASALIWRLLEQLIGKSETLFVIDRFDRSSLRGGRTFSRFIFVAPVATRRGIMIYICTYTREIWENIENGGEGVGERIIDNVEGNVWRESSVSFVSDLTIVPFTQIPSSRLILSSLYCTYHYCYMRLLRLFIMADHRYDSLSRHVDEKRPMSTLERTQEWKWNNGKINQGEKRRIEKEATIRRRTNEKKKKKFVLNKQQRITENLPLLTMPISLSICLSICLSVCLSVCLFVRQPVCLSVCLSVVCFSCVCVCCVSENRVPPAHRVRIIVPCASFLCSFFFLLSFFSSPTIRFATTPAG